MSDVRATARLNLRRDGRLGRWHIVLAVLTGILITETLAFIQVIESAGFEHLGMDFLFYERLGSEWLASGQWYLPRQFGPHDFAPMADNGYPPSALPLFAAGALLPWPVWWIVPIAVLGYVLYQWRPAPWALAVVVLLMMWPRSIGGYLYGNTTMWTSAGLAAGLAWGWPIVLLAIKPTVAPFGLLAIRHRSAWLAAGVLALASLPMLPLWFDYLTVLRNHPSGEWVPLLGDVPPMLIPVVAWAGRMNRS